MEVKPKLNGIQSENINPNQIKTADVVIGIPSYCEADNIAFVVEKCNEGLHNYFPDKKAVIINVDNNSPDNTRSAFLNAGSKTPKIYISTPEGLKGKGNNFYNLFVESSILGAETIIVVDADLKSITGEWIRDLATPILKNAFDFVTPLYSRNEYDGTITNNICYPLLYGLLGKEIRQPIGGDFALSASLVKYLLNQNWHQTTRQYGIDIFLTLNALVGDFNICQVGLGAKIHKPSAPKLGPMFTQVVGTLFKTLLENREKWYSIREFSELPLFGNVELSKPQNLSVDYKGMKATARYEYSINREILSQCLSPSVFNKLNKMYDEGKITIGIDLWTNIVYDLLDAYERFDHSPELIEAMKSLYFGRVVSFIKQTLELDHHQSEQQIQNQAKHFFKHRSRLIRKYQSKKVA
jgi:glycosyltransferase involved in cell wall biosynthesis